MCQFTVSCCLLGLGMTAPGEIWWSLLHFLETPHFGKALELWETSAQKHDRERKKPWDRTAPMELGARKAGSSENSTLISSALISILPSFVSSAGSGPEWGLSSGQWGIYDLGVSDFIWVCPSSLTRSLLCCWVSWICGWTSSSEVHHPRALCHLHLPALTKSSEFSWQTLIQKTFERKCFIVSCGHISYIDLQQNTTKPQN